MTRADALAELIANTENGIWIPETKVHVWELNTDLLWKAYRGSLDAALVLHQSVLPRHYAQLHIWPMPEMSRVDVGGGHTGGDGNPARAWLIAILKVLHAQEPAQ